MSAATATIIAGVAIAASTTATVVAAKTAAGASQAATAANKSSTDAALAYAKQQDVYSQTTAANRYAAQQAQTAPARATGNAAGAQMAQLLGLPAPPPEAAVGTAVPPVYNPAPMPGTPPSVGPQTLGPTPGQPVSPNQYGVAATSPAPQTMGGPGTVTTQTPTGTTTASTAAPASMNNPTMGPMVMMQAPDGTQQQVPVSQMQHYLQLGATQVAGA